MFKCAYKKGFKRVFVVFLFLIFMNNNLQSQDCCVFGGAFIMVAPHRLSYQYASVENKSLEKSVYQGLEFVIFYDLRTYSNFGYGLNVMWGKHQMKTSSKDIFACSIELNWHLLRQRKTTLFNPYIGFIPGVSGGFTDDEDDEAKLILSPVVGFNSDINDKLSINFNIRYQVVFEKPETTMLLYSIGIHWDLLHLYNWLG